VERQPGCIVEEVLVDDDVLREYLSKLDGEAIQADPALLHWYHGEPLPVPDELKLHGPVVPIRLISAMKWGRQNNTHRGLATALRASLKKETRLDRSRAPG
jgi:hypothetical protein